MDRQAVACNHCLMTPMTVIPLQAGQKLGMFLVKEEVPDLRLDPAVDESVVQAELRPFAERMLANAAMRRALEECKEVITKVHAVQERWDTRDERRAEKAAKKVSAVSQQLLPALARLLHCACALVLPRSKQTGGVLQTMFPSAEQQNKGSKQTGVHTFQQLQRVMMRQP